MSHQLITPPKPVKTWYKRKRFMIPAVLAALALAAGVAGQDAESSSGATRDIEPEVSAAPVQERNMPRIGEPASDGDFTFVVSGVDCSSTELGDRYINTRAQGVFCILDVAVTNKGDSAGSFFGENAKLLNTVGQEFSADTEAAIYLPDSDSIYEEINPGNTLDSKVIFDVPEGTVPLTVELHDSALSSGVTVALQ
jgi:hypothetical protein